MPFPPSQPVTIEATVNAPIVKVWEYFTDPTHVTKWAFASDDWVAPKATNDLRVGGKFLTRMESKDGKDGFDFEGVYTAVEINRLIEYDMSDGRHVKATFEETPEGVRIIQTFDPENENPIDIQEQGWQAILNNLKKYAES